MACQCEKIAGKDIDLSSTCIGHLWVFQNLDPEELEAHLLHGALAALPDVAREQAGDLACEGGVATVEHEAFGEPDLAERRRRMAARQRRAADRAAVAQHGGAQQDR